MLIKQQIKHFRALNKWCKTPLGSSLSLEFSRNLKQVSEYVRGETLLQLGDCGANRWLKELNYDHKWIATPCTTHEQNHLQASLIQLPFSRSSVDCVVAPLTLEPFGSSNNLLDEIDRVLKPMGYVILLSINPWSLWGGALKCGLLNCYQDSKVTLRTPFHLNRIFLQRGYRQMNLSNFCYIPPINNKAILNRLKFLDEVGKMLWPFPSGIYCYVAQKYEYIQPSLIVSPLIQSIPKGFKTPLQPAVN